MVNFEGEQQEQWYPQLPGGYQSTGHDNYFPSFQQGTPYGYPIQDDWSTSVIQQGQQQMAQGFLPFPQNMPFQPFPVSSPMSSQLQGSHQQAPASPPPQQAPPYPSAQTRAVDPGGIVHCMYRFTYVWTSRNRGFWFMPTFVGPQSIAGFRWDNRRHRWFYTGLDLNRIQTFTCL